MCDDTDAFTASTCDGASSTIGLAGIDDDTEVMIMGMSNGGGMATYGVVKYPRISGAVAVDFYGAADITSWLPSAAGATLGDLKIYTACDSAFYWTQGVTTGSVTFSSVYSLTAGTPSGVQSPAGGSSAVWFTVTPYTAPGSKLDFAVHGESGSPASCNAAMICHAHKQEQLSNPYYSCPAGTVHVWVNYFVDWGNDILAWVMVPAPPPSPPTTGGPVIRPRVKPYRPVTQTKSVAIVNDLAAIALPRYSAPTGTVERNTEVAPMTNAEERLLVSKSPYTEKFQRSGK